MESMNAIDVGTLLALVGFWLKTSQDKASAAEELGRMKQQIKSLETRAANTDNQLSEINNKLNQLVESNTRLETKLSLLLGRRGHKFLDTPIDLKA